MEGVVQVSKNTKINLQNFENLININSYTSKNSSSELQTKSMKEVNISDKELKHIEKELNNIAASLNFNLSFEIHRESGKIIVKIIDKETNKVIREIPPHSFLDFLSKFEKMIGIIFDRKS